MDSTDPSCSESWVSQPDVCRCCVSSHGIWDITSTYITETGEKEVYADMLQECYGITLSSILQWAPRMVCALCVEHLRGATNFRKQVLAADQQFLMYCNAKLHKTIDITMDTDTTDSQIRSEANTILPLVALNSQPESESETPMAGQSRKTQVPDSTGHGMDGELVNEFQVPNDKTIDVINTDTMDSHTRVQACVLKKKRAKPSPKSKKSPSLVAINPQLESSHTSAEPVDKFKGLVAGKKKRAIMVQQGKKSKRKATKGLSPRDTRGDCKKSSHNSGDDEPNVLMSTLLEKKRAPENTDLENGVLPKSFIFTGLQNEKQVSERKRIILTCNIVLQETNACPFRHHKSWFQCFFCQQDFMEINPLRIHTVTIHSNISDELKKIKRYPRSLQIEISNLECRHCALKLTDVSSMRRHFVDVHKKVIYEECIADYKVNRSPYACHLCEKQFHVFRSLTTHLNEHYANCVCDVCGKSFLNSKRLKVHKRTHENGQFPCNECGKVLKTKTSKVNHIESAHSKRKIKCQICFEPMKHYNDRIKHMSEVHNITHTFKCHICSREYNIKHYLATHIRQTHGHKNKYCLECGMAFVTNHSLKKHMLKHTGLKPYTCSVCCKSYARSYTLKEHMRAHDNEIFLAPE